MANFGLAAARPLLAPSREVVAVACPASRCDRGAAGAITSASHPHYCPASHYCYRCHCNAVLRCCSPCSRTHVGCPGRLAPSPLLNGATTTHATPPPASVRAHVVWPCCRVAGAQTPPRVRPAACYQGEDEPRQTYPFLSATVIRRPRSLNSTWLSHHRSIHHIPGFSIKPPDPRPPPSLEATTTKLQFGVFPRRRAIKAVLGHCREQPSYHHCRANSPAPLASPCLSLHLAYASGTTTASPSSLTRPCRHGAPPHGSAAHG